MESIALDMDDMFDQRLDHDDDEDYVQRRGLPDLETDTGQMPEHDANEADEVLNNLKNLKGAAKKRVSRPQPKLDSVRLQSDRGLAVLPSIFSNVKFRGKGYEAEDLVTMMNKLEHWAHRLFPKLSFDDFIERLEKLGNKREIQTCMKRIRLDMPMLNADVGNDNEGDDVAPQGTGSNTNNDLMSEMDIDEAYDDMIRRERESAGITTKLPALNSPVEAASSVALSQSQHSQQTSTACMANQGLTPEQMERIERNRRLAMEKRANKLGLTISKVVAGSPSRSVLSVSGRTSELARNQLNNIQESLTIASDITSNSSSTFENYACSTFNDLVSSSSRTDGALTSSPLLRDNYIDVESDNASEQGNVDLVNKEMNPSSELIQSKSGNIEERKQITDKADVILTLVHNACDERNQDVETVARVADREELDNAKDDQVISQPQHEEHSVNSAEYENQLDMQTEEEILLELHSSDDERSHY